MRDRNYMYPAIKGLIKGTEFEKLPKLRTAQIPEEIYSNKVKWINEWKARIVDK